MPNTATVTDKTPMAGTYTIGGTTPDFLTIQAAVDSLVACGVSDSVVFNIRDGVYEEQVSIPEIDGASASSTITFQSESGDSTGVVWQYGSVSSTENYTLRLDGADRIRIRQLTLNALGDVYGRVIEIRNGADYNIFEHNMLVTLPTTSRSDNFVNVYFHSSPTANSYNHFLGNNLLHGSRGIYITPFYSSPSSTSGTVIRKNIFTNQFSSGLSLYKIDSTDIISNEFYAEEGFTQGIGIEIGEKKVTILANRLYLDKGMGIFMLNCYGTETDPILCANNFIKINSGKEGIFSYNGSHQHFFYNTVRGNFSSQSFIPLHVLGIDGKKIYNNILANLGGGLSVTLGRTNSLQSDFNNFYAPSDHIGENRISINNSDLETWQQANGLDTNSLSLDPLFPDPKSIQINQLLLNNKGKPLSEVLFDLEGNTRDSQTPDMGAVEWTPPALDVESVAILPLTTPLDEQPQEIKMAMRNNGSSTIQKVTIKWSVNELMQPDFTWTGQLSSTEVDTFSIGLATFLPKQSNTIKVWTHQPNDGLDAVPVNDTTTLTGITPALAGIYTIGGDQPDFISFSEAVTTLENGGVLDTVIFQVRDGVYNEQLTINAYPNADSLRPVIFQSAALDSTKVTLSHDDSHPYNYTLQFYRSDWISFEHLTLTAKHANSGRVIEVIGDCKHINIKNSIIEGAATTSNSTGQALIYLYSVSSDVSEYFILENSRLLNGSYGCYSYFFRSDAKGTVIRGNTFTNQYVGAIYLGDQTTPTISANKIQLNTSLINSNGISLSSINGGAIISNNHIALKEGEKGIALYNVNGQIDKKVVVANNFISIGNKRSKYFTVYGIYIFGSNYQEIAHNTVHILHENDSSTAIYLQSGANHRIWSNIFANSGGGLAATYSALPELSDYNNFFSTGKHFVNVTYNDHESLTHLQTQGYETNSLTLNPFFLQPFNYEIARRDLKDRGYKNDLVLVDIEGTTRDTLPDIGALELDLAPIDAGISTIVTPDTFFTYGKQHISAQLENYGEDTLKKVTINWAVNEVPQPTVEWTGQLAPSDHLAIPLDTLNFEIDEDYDISCWTTNPDDMVDIYTINDTAYANGLTGSLAGVYTIGGINPDFANFNAAAKVLNQAGIADEVIFRVRDGIYREKITLQQIAGTNASRTVTFESESGDSSKVVLQEATDEFNTHILQLDGTDWTTFKNLSFRHTNHGMNQLIWVENGAHHNTFINNFIQSNHAAIHLLFVNGDIPNNYNAFIGNHFKNGQNGLLLRAGLYADNSKATIIDRNIFDDVEQRSIFASYHTDLIIVDNQIINKPKQILHTGITVNNCKNGHLTNNDLTIHSAQKGIELNRCSGEVERPYLVANNRVKLIGGNRLTKGINIERGEYLKILHNSVAINNLSEVSASAFSLQSNNSSLQIENNIFANFGSGYAFDASFGSNVISNYNNLYTNGVHIGRDRYGSEISDLATWQTTTALDGASISVNPQFTNDSLDLHVNNSLLNQAGTSSSLVTEDMDYQLRDLINPDIGADEFLQASTDVGISQIDSLLFPINAQKHPIYVSVANFGLDTLRNMEIHWTVNGRPQSPFSWSVQLSPSQIIDSVSIGDYNFSVNATGHIIKAWTRNPNSVADQNVSNDTSTVGPIYVALNGNYTIGGTSPDFQNFTEAVTALIKGGITGPVTFQVRDGIYTEQVEIPEIIGADSVNTITFRAESGDSSTVVLQTNAATSETNYVVYLNGADWIQFNQMTFENRDKYYARIFHLSDGA
ncbi:MAG: right-handed parallel beta-helix repeat-containing protein, partial [Bacteroidota bacterium]